MDEEEEEPEGFEEGEIDAPCFRFLGLDFEARRVLSSVEEVEES